MFAIFKRELKAYFTSPLGYVFLAIFYAFSGLFFYIFSLSVGLDRYIKRIPDDVHSAYGFRASAYYATAV